MSTIRDRLLAELRQAQVSLHSFRVASALCEPEDKAAYLEAAAAAKARVATLRESVRNLRRSERALRQSKGARR